MFHLLMKELRKLYHKKRKRKENDERFNYGQF